MLIEPSSLFTLTTVRQYTVEYLVLALEEETAVQAVVGSVVRAFRRLKPRSWEMSARGYALYSVWPQLSFILQYTTGASLTLSVHQDVPRSVPEPSGHPLGVYVYIIICVKAATIAWPLSFACHHARHGG